METRAKQTMGSRWVVMMFGVGIAGALCAHTVSLAEEATTESQSPSRSERPASGWASSKTKNVDAAIQEKLQLILANQQTILQKAEAVKEEVRIIQVRAASRSSYRSCPGE